MLAGSADIQTVYVRNASFDDRRNLLANAVTASVDDWTAAEFSPSNAIKK